MSTEGPPASRQKRPGKRDLLSDIIEYGEAARAMLSGISYEHFAEDDLRQSAVCYKTLCVSEAAARLLTVDASIPERYPDIPWHQIRGIGNVLRHGYRSLDIEIVWNAVAGQNLETLLKFAREELAVLNE